ncbi:Exfoliative toxin A [Streptococcus sp. DD12]|nr:Exfoliative toxin A [Streptococcus sp. DD12]
MLSGAILALFGLGKSWTVDWPVFSQILTGVGLCLWLAYVFYWGRHWRKWLQAIQTPAFASSFATFPMASLLLSHYISQWPSLLGLAQVLWWLAFGGHLALILYFTLTFAKKRWYQQVLPSWTVLYVGIAMGAVTSQVTGQSILAQLVFYFGLLASLILYPPLLIRLAKQGLPEALLAQKAILCAPLSLLLVAGQAIGVFQGAWTYLLIFLILSQALYVYVVISLKTLLRRAFSPAFSAMTFPLTISATALQLGLAGLHHPLPWLFWTERFLATLVLLYVLGQFICKSTSDSQK